MSGIHRENCGNNIYVHFLSQHLPGAPQLVVATDHGIHESQGAYSRPEAATVACARQIPRMVFKVHLLGNLGKMLIFRGRARCIN